MIPSAMQNVTVLGVPFFDGTADEAVALAKRGGLVVAPSGPGLTVDLMRDPAYRAAVTTAELALPDSGFMVLLWNVLGIFSGRKRLNRLSGLRFLRVLLEQPEVRERGASFWVMPSEKERDRNLAWLRANGFEGLTTEDCYVAPDYRWSEICQAGGELRDETLSGLIEERHPRWVFLNIGSGVQEPLGHWLRGRLPEKPAIICTGAAIAFLSGGQADIPPWADRLFLGWSLRVWRDPGTFLPRYARAFRLLPIVWRWRERLPPLRRPEA